MVRMLVMGLVAGLLAVSGVVLAPPEPAHACSCAAGGLAEHVRDADNIVTGRLARVDGDRDDPSAELEYLVAVDRSYQGQGVTRSLVVRSPAAPEACGLTGMEPGTEYIFFLQREDDEFAASSCGGTTEATDRAVQRLERVAGEGNRVTTPPRASFTRVADDEPDSFTRLAAPGGALALVGLLGLVLVNALGRER